MFLFFLIVSALASNVDPEFKKLYEAAEFEKAMAYLKTQPDDQPIVAYNLGSTAYQLKRYGESLAFFERANRLFPHDPDTQHNIRLVREKIQKEYRLKDLDPASTWLEKLADRIPIGEVRAVLGLVLFVIGVVLIRSYRKTRDLLRTFSAPAGLSCAVGLVITLSLSATQKIASSCPPAIVLRSEWVRSGPGENYAELQKVEPGLKVRITEIEPAENVRGWYQVRFSKDSVGWIKADAVYAY